MSFYVFVFCELQYNNRAKDLFTFPCNKRKQYIPDDDCRKAADSQEDEERNADKQENEACFIVFP